MLIPVTMANTNSGKKNEKIFRRQYIGSRRPALFCPSECTPIAMKLRPVQRAPRAHRPVMMQRVYVKSTPVASEQKQPPLTAHRLIYERQFVARVHTRAIVRFAC